MILTRTWLAAAGVVFGLELVALAVGYQILGTLKCEATGSPEFCSFLGSLIARGVAVAATFMLVLWARPPATRALACRIGTDPLRPAWLGLHLAGVALLFAPLATTTPDWGSAFGEALVPWLAGGTAAAAGALLWLAPAPAWLHWGREVGWLPLAALVTAFLLPDLAGMTQPLWDLSAPSRATFEESVRWVLDLAGTDPVTDPSEHLVGVRDFYVEIAQACSGIEGVALVLGFTTFYALLFRAHLSAGRFWLTVVPLGLAASWALNVLRIAALVAIGAYVSPEFAANGFHSYAGWMLFTLLAIVILFCAHSIGWLQRGGQSAAEPLRSDWRAACILPFLALMAADVVIRAAFHEPALAYPLRLLSASAVLFAFRRAYAGLLPWSPDATALGAGAFVGVAWLIARTEAGPADVEAAAAAAGLGGAWFVASAAARVAGTVLVVPLVEELFFSGYLLTRLDGPGPARALLAVAVSSALFAAMHDRWLMAFLAGVVFALVYRRRGRLADAVAAHVVANLVIAAWAVAAGDWAAL